MSQVKDLSDFLSDLGSMQWGYIIYRTVYTSESNELFPLVVQRLEAYMMEGLRSTYTPSSLRDEEATLALQVRQQCQNIVIEDREQFDNVTFAQLRAHFQSYIEDDETGRWESGGGSKMFVVVDAEVMQSILSAPAIPQLPSEAQRIQRNRYYIKIVDPEFERNAEVWFREGEWDGSMKASIFDLWYLWFLITDEEIVG